MKYFTKDNIFPFVDFPLYVNMDTPENKPVFHGHDFLEVVVIARGFGNNIYDSGRSYSIIQGDVFAISPPDIHGYQNTHELLLYNVLFDPYFIDCWEELSELRGLKEILTNKTSKIHLNIFERSNAEFILKQMLHEIRTRNVAFQIRLYALLLDFLILLGRATPRPMHQSNSRYEAVHRAVIHMEQHLCEPFRINELARRVHLNKSYLSEFFKKETGCSPLNYLLHLRIEHVKKQLSESSLSLAEIAHSSGFCDQSYMSRIFKQHESMTPSQFRSTRQDIGKKIPNITKEEQFGLNRVHRDKSIKNNRSNLSPA